MSIFQQAVSETTTPTTTTEGVPDEGMDWSTRARLALQGLTLNYGDEGYAQIRSILSRAAGGDLTYEDAVKEERDIITKAREDSPGESLALEIGGAVVPSIAMAIFSGGIGLPAIAANFGRLIASTGLRQGAIKVGKEVGIGAAEGFVAGTGAGEGSFGERAATIDTGLSTGLGAIASPALKGVIKGTSKVVGAFVNRDLARKALGSLPKAENAEIQRVAGETGLDPSDIISRIAAGETLPEMGGLPGTISDSAAINIRALYNRAGKGRGDIEGILRSRATDAGENVARTLQEDLTPKPLMTAGKGGGKVPESGTVIGTGPGLVRGSGSGNILKYFGEGIKNLEADEGKAYDKIYALSETSDGLNAEVLRLLRTQKRMLPLINDLVEAAELPALYKFNEGKGVLELTRDVDLETAEVLRGAISDSVESSYRDGKPKLAILRNALEGKLRTVIDDFSPELKDTRAQWAKIRSSARAFQDGDTIITKSPDEAEVIFSGIAENGTPDDVAAFRLGYASGLRRKLAANRTTLFNNLSDISKKDRLMLQTIYPEDSLTEAVRKVNAASAAANVKNVVLAGPSTAPVQAASKKIGTEGGAQDLVNVFLNPLNFLAQFRVLKRLVGDRVDELNADQITGVVKTLITDDADVMRRALNDTSAFGVLSRSANQLVDTLSSGVRRGSASTSAVDIREGESRALKTIVDSLTPETKTKVQAISQ